MGEHDSITLATIKNTTKFKGSETMYFRTTIKTLLLIALKNEFKSIISLNLALLPNARHLD